jgi:hypothetical protein
MALPCRRYRDRQALIVSSELALDRIFILQRNLSAAPLRAIFNHTAIGVYGGDC